MKQIKLSILLLASLLLASCDDYLTREPMDKVTDTPEFWNNEKNINSVVLGLYDVYFEGYHRHWNRSDWFAETDVADWVDDNAQTQATFFTNAAPATDDDHWNFEYVRRINTIVDRVGKTTLPDEAKNHWLGVGRFLRAMEYSKLVSKFGDVPWYAVVLESTDYEQLYRPRDPRTYVMDRVLEDLQYAAEFVRESDGVKGLNINKAVVLAFASRVMLFEGTWQKYKEEDTDKASIYLEAAKDFASVLMDKNAYSLCNDWTDLTTSLDLSGNPEVIIYRSYVDGVVMHSLMSFQNTEVQESSPSRDLINSYLSSNGLPIYQEENTLFKGDKWFFDEIADRDPRLYYNIDTTGLRLSGVSSIWAASGYYGTRFVNPDLVDLPAGINATNTTDAPVMKLNEVLLNYIEAAAELDDLGDYNLTQADFDKTINLLRQRPSTNMPILSYAGSELSVNGVVINDPNRDKDVKPLIWEIRRERRIELVYEGIRFNDLRRWGKLAYADMKMNKQLNRGAWVDKPRYVEWYNETYKPSTPITLESLAALKLEGGGDTGYLIPIPDESKIRIMAEKDYLYPIPLDQISLYESQGKTLVNNTGW